MIEFLKGIFKKNKNTSDDLFLRVRRDDNPGSAYYVYDNQINTAKNILLDFYNEKSRWCLLFAEMQSGKSGTFLSIPYILGVNDGREIINKKIVEKLGIDIISSENSYKSTNMFLLTGMNENELISQFKNDVAGFTGMANLERNIIDNSEMQKFIKTPKNKWTDGDRNIINRMKKNSLLLIDESHYGSTKKQILDQFLQDIVGIMPNGSNPELLENNNIYVVSISATPMAEMYNIERGNKTKKVLYTDDNYYGISKMFENKKVHQSYDLKDIEQIGKFIDIIDNFKKKGYIIVRSTSKEQNLILSELSNRNSNIQVILYDQESKKRIADNQDINTAILDNKPNQKTIIFIKGLLRAGKRLNTSNVLMTHDTFKSNVDTTAQSLLGRCCGYGKNKNIEIYCDISSARKYRDWVDSDYSIDAIPNKSKNIRGNKNIKIKRIENHISFDLNGDEHIEIIEIINKRAKNKGQKDKMINILNKLNNSFIDDFISDENFEVGTVLKVRRNNTSYKKQFLDIKNGNMFFSDYKPTIDDLGKKIIGASFDVDSNELLIYFGLVVRNNVETTGNSIYDI